MNTQSIIKQEARVCAPCYAPLPIVISKGKGCWVWDVEGKKYLDMMSAYSANSFGHGHPRLLKALKDQSEKLSLISRAFHDDQLAPYLEKACEVSGMEMGIPMNTGAEAVETAIKACRRWGYEAKGIPEGKAEIIVAGRNFHGRTITIVSFSTEPEYKRHFGPYTPGFKVIPFGDEKALEEAITPHTCAFLVEPIQGEAGIIVPPTGWLRACKKICTQNNVLLVLDEIQSGLGRTGKMFAFQYEDIVPDGLILGKALGGGFLPVSLFLSRKEILSLMRPGSHGSTFGGNALASAMGREALTVLEEEGLPQRSAHLGEFLKTALKAIKSPLIKDIRGRGLWMGLELDSSACDVREFCLHMAGRGVLTKDMRGTTIRLAPPLIITQEELDFFLSVLKETLEVFEKKALIS